MYCRVKELDYKQPEKKIRSMVWKNIQEEFEFDDSEDEESDDESESGSESDSDPDVKEVIPIVAAPPPEKKPRKKILKETTEI